MVGTRIVVGSKALLGQHMRLVRASRFNRAGNCCVVTAKGLRRPSQGAFESA
jgi:hypothetical protein